jgi:hypothetical protein
MAEGASLSELLLSSDDDATEPQPYILFDIPAVRILY